MENPFKSKKVIAITCGVLTALLLICLVISGLGYYVLIHLNRPEVVYDNALKSLGSAKSMNFNYSASYDVDYSGSPNYETLNIDATTKVKYSIGKSAAELNFSELKVDLDSDTTTFSDINSRFDKEKIQYKYSDVLESEKLTKIQREEVDYIELRRDTEFPGYELLGYGLQGMISDMDSFLNTDLLKDNVENLTREGNIYTYKIVLNEEKSKQLSLESVPAKAKEKYKDSYKSGYYEFTLTVNQKTGNFESISIEAKDLTAENKIGDNTVTGVSNSSFKFENIEFKKDDFDFKFQEGNSISYESVAKDISLVSGDANVRTHLFVISTFGERFTARWKNEVLPEIKKNYIDTGKISISFYPGAVSTFGTYPKDDHMAYYCAFEYDVEFEMMTALMQEDDKTARNVDYYLNKLGDNAEKVNKDLFTKCINTKKYESLYIKQQKDFGGSVSNYAEPKFYITNSGKKDYETIEGAYPYQTFADAIEKML